MTLLPDVKPWDSLFDLLDVAPRKMSIDERFLLFNYQNPQVLVELERLADLAFRRGNRRIGIAMLVEVVRWNAMLTTDDATCSWKINNSYRSRFVRLMIARHREWSDLFELRELRS